MSDARHDYRHLWRQTLLRMLLTYLAPLLLLAVYFQLQYRDLGTESRRHHLISIAENQASTLELFLRERLVNLTNLIDDPNLPSQPSAATTEEYLARLRRESPAFVDLGFFDAAGTMVSYAGPFPILLGRCYGNEGWFAGLNESEERFVITDMYLGFRQHPHFTIAIRRIIGGGPVAIRATLDPGRISEYITTLTGSTTVHSVLVSAAGSYQTVSLPEVLTTGDAVLIPAIQPVLGADVFETDGAHYDYAYCWLNLTDWALIVLWTEADQDSLLAGLDRSLLAISVAVILAVFSTIVIRAGRVVRQRKVEDRAKREISGQLRHAARLASVGELAAGIAHEINNPLAIIAEEAGVMNDRMDPDLPGRLEEDDIRAHLEVIHEAVFRARDITRKLLSFVRKEDVRLVPVDVSQLVETMVGGLLEREMSVANIEVVRDYADHLPRVFADQGQIEQVVLNLLTNANDAMPDGGQLTVATSAGGGVVRIAVSDTGVGIAPEQMERIFMPFHTTKEVGKGTGLGLSVSYGIIESYGGEIVVESVVGEGSTFTVILPLEPVVVTGNEGE